jgi:hypothetical protein
MIFTGSMFTLASPLATGALMFVGGQVTNTQPNQSAPAPIVVTAGISSFQVFPVDLEDRAGRDVGLSDLTQWGRSMAGGSTAHMLDV